MATTDAHDDIMRHQGAARVIQELDPSNFEMEEETQ